MNSDMRKGLNVLHTSDPANPAPNPFVTQHNSLFTGDIQIKTYPIVEPHRQSSRLLENIRTILMGIELTQAEGEQIIELVRTRMRKP